MDQEKLFKYLQQRYFSRRDILSRIPLGINPDSLWRELLNRRRSESAELPLYSSAGTPFWYMTTDKMISASEKIIEAMYENETEFDPYTQPPPVLTLEEVFFTSYVEGSRITMQDAMDFLTGGQPPRDIEEQLISNNRRAGGFSAANLYRSIDEDFLKELAFILTDGMENGGHDYRANSETDFSFIVEENFEFPSPYTIPERVRHLCVFLSSDNTHPLIKAAAAQGYILAVRPFPEGNERLGRILSNMILLRSGYTFFGDVSLSSLIARRTYEYFEAVSNILRKENGGDLTYFIEYYLDLLSRAVDERRLRIQQKQEKLLQSEQEFARKALSPPDFSVSGDEPQPGTHNAQKRQEQDSVSAEDNADFFDGFISINPNDDILPGDDNFSRQEGLCRSDILKKLYRMKESNGILVKKSACLLLDYLDNGIQSFTVENIRNDLDITQKQAENVITHLKGDGIIEGFGERTGGLRQYCLAGDDEHLAPRDYSSEIIEAVKQLRVSTRSSKDKRTGQLLTVCMPKGTVTVEDYAEYGDVSRLAIDMALPEKMGIVKKINRGIYRINRSVETRQPSLSESERTFLKKVYEKFKEKPFTREDAMEVCNLSRSCVGSYLHQLIMLQIAAPSQEINYHYKLLVNPKNNPDLFNGGPRPSGDSPQKEQKSENADAGAPRSDYAPEVYRMIKKLEDSQTSPRDRRLAKALRLSLSKGTLLRNDYDAWGFTDNMWQTDTKLAKQLGLISKQPEGGYILNRTLKPVLLPHQKKTVTAIYDAFGDREFSSEMFIATLNYSASYTYASLHKLMLLQIVDQEGVGEDRQYRLLVNPEDHPECFESAA
ncbi:MAG: Fic family protein [Clostridiales bacterium]|nr:Fic family protein [Clostridiales bacterium]